MSIGVTLSFIRALACPAVLFFFEGEALVRPWSLQLTSFFRYLSDSANPTLPNIEATFKFFSQFLAYPLCN